ncbi:uncharacterized protein LAJ45_06221 [Morchella importuna]|uniref:uncharacterized protein n=1 Tax=Morchella importuna TaxID=1174673 RepID=UPI001E8E7A1F|nr:uncharacterized protein LAJ45_06221 [Morchella importuna]KAH8149591.1 hypothetical protein LAJ45_06221 [Morchella importuna]
MKVQCQIITTPADDSPGTTLLLHFDQQRYMIGQIGEGAQRAFVARSARLKKISNIFLTGRTQWQNTGGLIGFLLTLGDKEEGKTLDAARLGKPNVAASSGVTVHGGENLMHTLATARPFVFRKAMKLKVREIPQQSKKPSPGRTPYYGDENLTVHPMHIFPDGHKNLAVVGVGSEKSSEESSPSDDETKRKRSFEDFSGKESVQKAQNRKSILQGVVENMFCSDWTMDTMMEDSAPVNENDMMRNSVSGDSKRQRSSPPTNNTFTTQEYDFQLSTRPPPPGKTRAPWPASTVTHLPRSKPSEISLSYLFTLRPVRGKFLPKKAISLGVKPGPDFSKICNGESIVVADGKIVRPEDVMEPTKPGTGFAVCDLPDPSYINDFLARDEWRDIERLRVEVECFFWILGKGVIKDENLKKFMKNMAHARHVVSSPDVCPNTIFYQGAAGAATKLNMMDESFFPIPLSSNKALIKDLEGIQPALPGLVWQLEPKRELLKAGVMEFFDVEKAVKDTEPDYVQLANAVKTQTLENAAETSKETPWKDVEIITLGTGSASPSGYRNVSATLVRVPNAGSVLFDCGESTVGQLRRLYTSTELAEVLKDLKAIYISHLHADHHLGTTAVLKAWYNEVHLKNEEVIGDGIMNVVAPWKFLVWLKEYADVEEFGFSKIRFVACGDIPLRAREQARDRSIITSINKLPDVLNSISLKDIQTSPAVHCQGSFVTAWTWKNGFKLAYSGDTRPTSGFVKIGKDATVLLHEATFDDELQAEAIAKKHSTTSEALRAGMDMGAKGVILTHFSQRYPKLPVFSTKGDGNGMDIVLAFDLCRIRVGDMGRFAGFLPALRELYRYDDDVVANLDEEEEEGVKVKVEVEVGAQKKKPKKEKNMKEMKAKERV